MRMLDPTKQSHLCSMLFEQPIKLLLIEIELTRKMLLHCEALHIDMPN
jgi:hypothetical protein